MTIASVLPVVVAAAESAQETPVTVSPWTGTWTLDRAASDALDPVLIAQGVSLAKRTVARNLDLVQKLVDHGDRFSVEMEGPRSKQGMVIFDGKEHSENTDQGTVLYRAKREESGSVVVVSRPAEGGGLITVVSRSLDATGQTLRQTITVKGGTDGPVAATLVFRRAS
jgi:hypothetical protein